MSLLKRLEAGASFSMPTPTQDTAGTATLAQPEPTLRPVQPVNQATEAQRNLKDRVKRKLISELDPSIDTTKIDEVRQRLKSLFDQIIEAENLVLTRAE